MNNIIDIFKVGVYKTNIIDKNIEKYLYGVLKDTSSFVFKSNKGGLQTKPILDINEEINKKLFITPAINFCKQMGLSKNIKIQTESFWINVNKKGSYNSLHNHLPNSISGVYYLNVPKNSGRLVFCNKFDYKKDASFFCDTDISSYYKTHYYITPQKDDLFLFQSDLNHFVEPNHSNKQRISISFNINVFDN